MGTRDSFNQNFNFKTFKLATRNSHLSSCPTPALPSAATTGGIIDGNTFISPPDCPAPPTRCDFPGARPRTCGISAAVRPPGLAESSVHGLLLLPVPQPPQESPPELHAVVLRVEAQHLLLLLEQGHLHVTQSLLQLCYHLLQVPDLPLQLALRDTTRRLESNRALGNTHTLHTSKCLCSQSGAGTEQPAQHFYSPMIAGRMRAVLEKLF